MTPWTVAHQAAPSMEFSRQEYWSGLPFPSLADYVFLKIKEYQDRNLGHTWWLGLPWLLSGKEPACQCGRHGFDSWVGTVLWRRKQQLTPVFLLGKSCGQRSLVGCSPWGHKESDTTEQLSTVLNLRQPFSNLIVRGFAEESYKT